MERLARTHTTYQDASALLVVIDGRQVEGGASMLPALLDVDHIPVLTHHPQRLDLVQLGGQVHGRLLLLIQDSSVHRTERNVKRRFPRRRFWQVEICQVESLVEKNCTKGSWELGQEEEQYFKQILLKKFRNFS